MWPDFRKSAFHAPNSKTHFSPSKRWLYTHALTNNSVRGICTESCSSCFCCGLFLSLFRRPRMPVPMIFKWLELRIHLPLKKQTDSCHLPHPATGWLSLAMDLLALYDMWKWKLHQWTPFGCFRCWRSLCPPLCGYTLPSHPMYMSANGSWLRQLKFSKMAAIL